MEEIKQLLQVEFGTLDELSKLFGVRNSAVYQWVARGQIPIRHLKKLNVLSEGRLTKEMLRPDLFKKD
jgi:DNA-binding transcriptional regulator YdaS (Cro superfamily)